MDTPYAWESFPSELETLSITGSTKPENFSSNCVVVPIITSSNFMMNGSGSIKLDLPNGDVDGKKEVFEYGRMGNPTRSHLEEYFAVLEGSKYALAFGSGVGGLSSIVLSLSQGDHILASSALYGGSISQIKIATRFGISSDFFETSETDEIIKLIKPNTKMIYLESPSNPQLRLFDISAIAKKAHEKGIIVVVDNTFLTPVFQRCLRLGADVVLYSCSKYIGGHADVIMGMVATNNPDLYEKFRVNQEAFGAIPSPFDCYLTIRSLKTLHLRMKKHSKNGFKLAKFLESHPLVEKVIHPGLKSHPHHELAKKQQEGHSGMVGFYIKGQLKEAAKFMDKLKVVRRAPSLGADISLVTIPARMSHIQLSQEERNKLGVTDNFIRLSVGLEAAKDLIEDVDQALKQAVL